MIAADTLDECLRARHAGGKSMFARRFQRRLAKRNADPWMLSTGEDLRFPTTTGAKVTRGARLLHRYLDRVLAARTLDPDAAQAYMQVVGMLARPASLFAPSVVAAAPRAGRTDPSAEPPTAPLRAVALSSA